MKPIKFIDNLSFSPDGELVSAGSSYRGSAVFMRQGDLDGACAIYSLMMMLIMNHRVGSPMFVDVLGDNVGDIRIQLLPLKDFLRKVVFVEVAGEHI